MKYGDQKWIAEKSFSFGGYGGKVDMASETYEGRGLVIDFKTSSFDDPKEAGGYDEHLIQLSAYAVGLFLPSAKLANVYVSTTVPGLVVIKEYPDDDFKKGFAMFDLCLKLWQLQKGYAPC